MASTSNGGITRREFLKIAGITSVLVGVGGLSYKTLRKAEEMALEAAATPKIKYAPGHCGMCPQGCSIMVRIANGRVERIFGNPYGYVFNRATICARGNMGVYRLYNPDRLMKPLMRTGGERGTWQFKEVSWEEAFNDFLNEIKPMWQEMMQAFQQEYEKVYQQTKDKMKAMMAGMAAAAKKDKLISAFGWFGCDIYRPHIFAFLISLGFSNAFSQPIATCFLPKALGWASVWGVGVHPELMVDYDNTRLLISIRRNPFGSISVSHGSRVGQDLRRFKLIVVDPRLSEEAARADEWIPIRPGTDLALLLAMMYVIIRDELYDAEYLREYSNATMLVDPDTLEPLELKWRPGMEPNPQMPYPFPWSVECFKVYDEADGQVKCNTEAKLPALRGEYTVNGKKYVPVLEALYRHLEKNGYTPEWASKITDIPADKIEMLAQEFGRSRPAAIDTGWHGTKTYNSFQTWRAIAMLNALVGSLGRPGGILMSAEGIEGSKSNLNPAGMPAPAWTAMKFMAPPWSPLFQYLAKHELTLSDGTKTTGPLINLGRSFIVLDKVIESEPGWIIFNGGGNPARTTADGNDWFEKVLTSKNVKKIYHYDILPMDTALFSDVVFTDCTYLEVYDLVRPIEYVPYAGVYTAVPALDKPIADCLPYPVFVGLIAKEFGRAKEYGMTFGRLLRLPEDLQQKMAELYDSLDRTVLTDVQKRIEFLAKIQEIQIEAIARMAGMSVQQVMEELRTKGALVFKGYDEIVKENMELLENHKLYTATGMIEIFSVTLYAAMKIVKQGVLKPEWHPIIDWVPPRAMREKPPEKMGPNDFYLIYGKAPTITHTSATDNPLLERLTEEMFRRIWIHPDRAAKLGVSEGDWVEVCNVYGKCYKTRVHVTERVRPDTAFIVNAWGHKSPKMRFAPSDKTTVPYNKLIPPEVDPVTASVILGDTVVSIKKA